MMKKFILMILMIVAMIGFTACDDNNNRNQPMQPLPPEPIPPTPIPPVPPIEPDPTVPDVGTGSLSYNPSCNSGFAYVVYVYQSESTIDNNSFVILHSADGNRKDIQSGSVFGNGSVSRMEADIYIAANDTDVQIAHQVEVQYISSGVSQSQSFSFIQPACEIEEPEEPEPVSMVVGIAL